MSPRRRLPAGSDECGAVYASIWRDAAGRQYCRNTGDTQQQAKAFMRRIDDQLALGDDHLALGDCRPVSTTTFGVYAQSWVEVRCRLSARRGH